VSAPDLRRAASALLFFLDEATALAAGRERGKAVGVVPASSRKSRFR
jgi:hypothetical protein